MIRKKSTKGLVMALVSSAVLVSSCSNSSSDGNNDTTSKPTGPSGAVSKEDAADFAKQGKLDNVVTMTLAAVDPKDAVTKVRSSSQSTGSLSLTDDENRFDDCVTKTGDDTDKDSDGVPANLELTYTCQNKEASASSGESAYKSTFSYTGKIAYKDEDDNNRVSPFTMTVSDLVYNVATEISGASSIKIAFNTKSNGTVEMTVPSATERKTKIDMTTSIDFAKPEGLPEAAAAAYEKYKSVVGYYFESTFKAADGDTAEKPKGLLTISGLYKFEGVSTANATEGNTAQANYVFKVEGTDLEVDPSCTTAYKSGKLRFTDGANKVLEVTYANCQKTVTYDGTAI